MDTLTSLVQASPTAAPKLVATSATATGTTSSNTSSSTSQDPDATPTPALAPTAPPPVFVNMPAELNAGLTTTTTVNSILPQLYILSDNSSSGSVANGVLTALSFASQPSNLLSDAGAQVSAATPTGTTLTSTSSVADVLGALPMPPGDDASEFRTGLLDLANTSVVAAYRVMAVAAGRTVPLGSADAPLVLDATSSPALGDRTSLKVYGSVQALTSSIFVTDLTMKAGSIIAGRNGAADLTLASNAILGHDTMTISKTKGMTSYGLFVDPFTQGGLIMVQRSITSTATGSTMKFSLDFRDFSNYKVDASGNFTTPGLSTSDSRVTNFRSLVQNYSHAVVSLAYAKLNDTSGTVTVSFSDVRNFSGATVIPASQPYSFPPRTLRGVDNGALLAISNLN